MSHIESIWTCYRTSEDRPNESGARLDDLIIFART